MSQLPGPPLRPKVSTAQVMQYDTLQSKSSKSSMNYSGPDTPRLSSPTMSYQSMNSTVPRMPSSSSMNSTVYKRSKSKSFTDQVSKPGMEPNVKNPLPPPPPPPSTKKRRCSPRAKKQCHEITQVIKVFISLLLMLGGATWSAYKVASLYIDAHTPVSLQDSGSNCSRNDAGDLVLPTLTNGLTKPIHLNILEPRISSTPLFGFQLDWAIDSPALLDQRMGRRVAVIGAWVQLNATGYERNMLAWYPKALADQAKTVGGVPSILLVTVRPTCTLDKIRQQDIDDLASQLADINHSLNVPVILRWAHEMNGNWDTYGQKPLAYVKMWRRVHDAIKIKTSMTAMIWSPNGHNCGYPWKDGVFYVNQRDPEQVALDTNKDGVINMADDPYGPYFPGADYVEWIGLSTYHYGYQPTQAPVILGYNDGTNILPDANRFLNIINGQNICPKNQPVWSIYDLADKYDKPFGVPETGAVYYEDTVNGAGPGELAIKRAWWRQILTPTVFKQLPRLKMVVWFEEDKYEYDRGKVSYSVTNHPDIRKSFLADFPLLNVLWADQLGYKCNGTVTTTL